MQSELETSEEQINILFEYAPDAYYLSDLRGTFVDGNIAAEELTGYSRIELIGQSFLKLKLLPRKFILKAAKLLTLNALGKPTGPDEFILLKKDGTKVQVEIRTFPVKIKNQTLVLGIARDITSRIKRELLIEHQNEFLNKVLSSLDHPFYVLDATDYTIHLANSAAGFANLKGLTCYELTHKTEVPCGSGECICPLEEVKKTKKPVIVEHVHYDRDGSSKIFEVHGYPIFDDVGNVIQMIEYSLDITEQKKMKEEMMIKDNAVESSINAIAFADLKGDVTYVNDSFLKMWGFDTFDEVLGNSVESFWQNPEDALKIVEALTSSGGWIGELVGKRKDGSPFNIGLSSNLVTDNAGKPICMMASFIDITDRIKNEKLLKDATEKWVSLTKNTNDMIIIIDNKNIIQYMNWTVPPYTLEEVVGKSIYDYMPIEQHEITKKTLESVFKEGKSKSYEISSVIPKTGIRWFFTKVIPIKQDGKVISVIELVSDITERKKLITEIEDLAKFPSENPNPVMRIDNNGVLLYANDVSKSWIHKWNSGIGKTVPKAWIKHVNHVVKSSLNEFVEFEHNHRVYSFLFAPVDESNYVHIYGRDITERKIAENELKYSNENLENLVEEKTKDLRVSEDRLNQFMKSSPDGFIILDSELNYIDINDIGMNVFPEGTKKEDIIGKNIEEIVPNIKETGRFFKYMEVLKTGKPFFVEDLVPHPKFGDIHLTLRAFKVGNNLGIITTNITERKLIDQQLQDAKRMATIGETAGMVGHDLRNPLQAMVNITYLMGKKIEAMPPPLQKLLEKESFKDLKLTLDDQIEYMNKIVSDLQDYARTINLKLVDTNLEQLIRDILLVITIPSIIEVSIELPDNLRLMVDPAYMKRVFINLFTNAMQAMPNGGVLRISASKTASDVLIHVKDTGVGISEENLTKLFQPLFTTKAQGQGFGLAVCKRIVEAHGGVITVESIVGEGSTIIIRFPL